MKRGICLAVFLLVLLLVVMVASPGWSQTTITTDGDIEAQGFIGNGSQVTDVDAQSLDGVDSSAFALDADLQNVEALLLALGTAPVPRTGQATCYDAAGSVTTCGAGVGLAQDGDLQLGVTWPNPRFTENGDGTVTDELTGLIWLEDANCFGTQFWTDALAKANALFDGCPDCGGTANDCGLSDGSLLGAWRLANLRELQSLVHYGVSTPAVPNTAGTGQWVEDDPFWDVLSASYWTSTTRALTDPGRAWVVGMHNGHVLNSDKDTFVFGVWPVRGGQ